MKKDKGDSTKDPSKKTRTRRGAAEPSPHEDPNGNGKDKMPMPAHLYVGPRDVRIKLGEDGMLQVLKDQKDIRRQITECEQHLVSKQTQIDEAQELLTKRRAEFREIEGLKEELAQRVLDIIDANSDGFHLERIEVDEVFISGEIVTYRKGTKEEVGVRRNALPDEWEAAQEAKDAKGRLLTRFQKGKPSERKGFVVIDGGKEGPKEVRSTEDGMGYIGPEEDPRKPKKDGGDKKNGKAAAKGQKVVPHSLKIGDAPPLEPLDPPKAAKGTFMLRVLDASKNDLGAMKVVRQIVDIGASAAKKLLAQPTPIEVTRDLTEENARLFVKMLADVEVEADCIDAAAPPVLPPPDLSPAPQPSA